MFLALRCAAPLRTAPHRATKPQNPQTRNRNKPASPRRFVSSTQAASNSRSLLLPLPALRRAPQNRPTAPHRTAPHCDCESRPPTWSQRRPRPILSQTHAYPADPNRIEYFSRFSTELATDSLHNRKKISPCAAAFPSGKPGQAGGKASPESTRASPGLHQAFLALAGSLLPLPIDPIAPSTPCHPPQVAPNDTAPHPSDRHWLWPRNTRTGHGQGGAHCPARGIICDIARDVPTA